MTRCKLLAFYATFLLALAVEVTLALADGSYWPQPESDYAMPVHCHSDPADWG